MLLLAALCGPRQRITSGLWTRPRAQDEQPLESGPSGSTASVFSDWQLVSTDTMSPQTLSPSADTQNSRKPQFVGVNHDTLLILKEIL